jgi:hypothetical protein
MPKKPITCVSRRGSSIWNVLATVARLTFPHRASQYLGPRTRLVMLATEAPADHFIMLRVFIMMSPPLDHGNVPII